MARTVINVDEEALREAAEILGTSTKVDTVNTALREIVARHKQRRFLDALDRSDFGKDPEMWKRAWRE